MKRLFALTLPALPVACAPGTVAGVRTFVNQASHVTARTVTRRTVRLNRALTPLAGIAFLLAGLFDTFVCWLLQRTSCSRQTH